MVRKWAGMDSEARVSLRFGARRHFELEPWTERMELYWADCGQMYVTPVSQKEICLVFLSRDSELRLEEALPAFPALCKRLDGAANSSKPRGAISATRVLKRVTAGRVALVGDASGSVDVITGEGMALSFRQAIALADAIEMGDLGYYATRHRELSVLPSRMANLMLLLDRHPSLQTRILYALSKTPSTFGKLLAAHVGRCSLPMTLATEVPKVAWNLLLAWNRSLESSNSSPSDSVQMLAN